MYTKTFQKCAALQLLMFPTQFNTQVELLRIKAHLDFVN